MEMPKVSICCITYNHEKYIRKALESFLMQKCDFSFEILIHDDASTDKTPDIIRSFARRYPDIIYPILQTENQFSQGITNPSGIFNFPRARGQYIALCEGDDYWLSPHKLQKQADFMDSHPNVSFCFHGALVQREGIFYRERAVRPYRGSRLLSPREVIDKKNGYPTASLFFRTESVRELPAYYRECPIGDIPLQLHLATFGSAWYMDEFYSVYRIGAPSSWSVREKEGDYKRKQEIYYRQMKTLYDSFNRATKGRYQKAAARALMRIRFLTYVNLKEYRRIFQQKYRRFFRELSPATRILTFLEYRLPGLYRRLRETYRLLSFGTGGRLFPHLNEQAKKKEASL